MADPKKIENKFPCKINMLNECLPKSAKSPKQNLKTLLLSTYGRGEQQIFSPMKKTASMQQSVETVNGTRKIKKKKGERRRGANTR